MCTIKHNWNRTQHQHLSENLTVRIMIPNLGNPFFCFPALFLLLSYVSLLPVIYKWHKKKIWVLLVWRSVSKRSASSTQLQYLAHWKSTIKPSQFLCISCFQSVTYIAFRRITVESTWYKMCTLFAKVKMIIFI